MDGRWTDEIRNKGCKDLEERKKETNRFIAEKRSASKRSLLAGISPTSKNVLTHGNQKQRIASFQTNP